ncbi:MAG TPA: c-type cytochrome [Vicinamibacterales bacterium]|nr:c-type cytochrome [Vicinamibacterales bacterium]
MTRSQMLLSSGAALLLATACAQTPPPPPPAAPAVPAMSQVDRGKYIVSTSACHDCHTPTKMGPNGPEPDMDRALSGHPESIKITKPAVLPKGIMAGTSETFTAWHGPWGVSFTANLTPDENTGLGIWTEDMFMRAIREGKHMGQSRPILPPMPWQVYRNFTDDDLKAIFAYLKSIKPIVNHVPDPIPPAGSAK